MTGSVWVVLGEERKNAKIRTFEDTLEEGNVAIVAGAGEAAERLILETGETTLTGFARREIYVNASYAEDTASMQTAGAEALEEAKSTTIELDLLTQSLYGTDFTLGDILSVDMGNYGHYALRVTEAETSYTSEARRISLTLGAERKGVLRIIRDSITSIPSRRA